jgi:hypothetical protein
MPKSDPFERMKVDVLWRYLRHSADAGMNCQLSLPSDDLLNSTKIAHLKAGFIFLALSELRPDTPELSKRHKKPTTINLPDLSPSRGRIVNSEVVTLPDNGRPD